MENNAESAANVQNSDSDIELVNFEQEDCIKTHFEARNFN